MSSTGADNTTFKVNMAKFDTTITLKVGKTSEGYMVPSSPMHGGIKGACHLCK